MQEGADGDYMLDCLQKLCLFAVHATPLTHTDCERVRSLIDSNLADLLALNQTKISQLQIDNRTLVKELATIYSE